MYCKKCGTYNSNNNLICKKCKDNLVNQYLNDNKNNNYKNIQDTTQNTNKNTNEISSNNQSKTHNNKSRTKKEKHKKKRKNKKQLLNTTNNKHNKYHKKNDSNKNQESKNTNGCFSKIFIYFLMILIILLTGICTILGSYILNEKIVKMPNVLNLTKEDALKILSENEINYEIKEQNTQDESQINIVLNQNEKAGEYILKSKIVTITIGTQKNTELPEEKKEFIILDNLIGKTKEQAIEILTQKNINYIIKEIESDEKDNIVIDQVPINNEKITKDTIVTLYISKVKTNNTSENIITTNPSPKTEEE